MFNKFKKASAAGRLLEEQLYEKVLHELSKGQIRDGLWSKAVANSDGVEEKGCLKTQVMWTRYAHCALINKINFHEIMLMNKPKKIGKY